MRQYTLNGEPRPVLNAGQLNGMLKGFIDLMFEHQGRYYVADYKSNWLGRATTVMTPRRWRTLYSQSLRTAVLLYLFALHRLLKLRLRDYDYERHVGGAVYVFLRGHFRQSRGTS